MQGQLANELGHSNYQHPGRNERHFGPSLDDFSAWIIYYSLLFLKLDPGLWQRHEGGDDCLLFRRADFVEPDKSRLLAELARHPVPDIRTKVEHVQELIRCQLERVPKFSIDVQKRVSAVPVRPTGPVTASSQHPTVVTGTNWSALSIAEDEKLAPVPERWPAADAYYKALRMPMQTLLDDNLNKCLLCTTFGKNTVELEVDAGAMTFEKAALRGRRHVVFRMALIDGSRHYAIKCFLQTQSERQIRWDAIKKHKKPNSNKFFTQFIYLPKGIVIAGETYPVVKMLWVNGETIDRYVARHLQIGFVQPIELVKQQFIEMMQALAADGIAHGDLEPSNILVTQDGQLILVDYDNMYVPSLAHLQSTETGHPNFQHPNRNLSNLGPYLDNFSAIVIDGILACMNADPPEQLRNWDSLLQHVKQKSDGRVGGQPSPMNKWASPRATGTQIRLGGTNAPFQAPSAESWNTIRDSELQESKFETASNKLARQIKEMHKYRLDLVPPPWAVRTSGS
jgi:hypothetical protein